MRLLVLLFALHAAAVETRLLDDVIPPCGDSIHPPAEATYAKDYTPPNYTIDFTSLHFDLDADITRVTSNLSIRTLAGGDLWLDGSSHLTLHELYIDGEDVRLSKSFEACFAPDHSLIIRGDDLPDKFNVTTVVTHSPKANRALFGLYESQGMLLTQNESAGFRRITFFMDRPDVQSVFNVTLEARYSEFPVLLANGQLVSDNVDTDTDRHTAIFHDPWRKPAYLFALVAGNLEALETNFTIGRPCREAVAALYRIPSTKVKYQSLAQYCKDDDSATAQPTREARLVVWGRPGQTSRLAWALQSLQRAMLWDEVRFGRFYDLDVYHVVATRDFNAGAMENKGLNIFNVALVEADESIATDAQFERVEGVIAHEYFHNWSGDRVTLRDWFQLTLKEGFTVLRDELFTQDVTNCTVKRVQDARFMRDVQFAQDASPLSHAIRPDSYATVENFYTVTVYEKGAEIARMYQTLLGTKCFREATDVYFETYDQQSATCEDFKAAMEEASGKDLSQFFLWYSTSGTPLITVKERYYDAEAHTYTITLSQSSRSDSPLVIPIRALLYSAEGEFKPLSPETVLTLQNYQETYTFEDVHQDAIPSLLRDFSAPVKLEDFLSESELLRLAAYETDAYNRWNAVEGLMQRFVSERLAVEALPLQRGLKTWFAAILNEAAQTTAGGERSLLALLLRSPSLSGMESVVIPFYPKLIWQSMKSLRTDLVREFREPLEALYNFLKAEDVSLEDYAITPDQVGQRALKNVILSYLAHDEENETYRSWLTEAITQANNENDRAAALSIVAGMRPTTFREELEKHYLHMAGDEDLLVDRWLATQASSHASDTTSRVLALMKHPLFAGSETPNRLRALIRTYSSNLVSFHDEDGRGYELVANEVLRWDTFNPKLAASLATAFSRGTKLPSHHRAMMRAQVARIHNTEGISLNLREIVSKVLKSLKANDQQPVISHSEEL